MASLGASGGGVVYVCVVRFGDRAIVASYSHGQASVDDEAVRRLFAQPDLLVEQGRRYRVPTDSFNYFFMSDPEDRVFLAIVRDGYPDRVAFRLIEDLREQFVAKWADKSLVCKEHALARAANKMMGRLCESYDSPEKVDSVAAVEAKVEVVKVTMQQNISQILESSAKLESIHQQAEELQVQAGVFKKNATTLRKKMWWRDTKWKLILFFVVAAVLGSMISILVCVVGKAC